jgi:predicted transcriptional regulator
MKATVKIGDAPDFFHRGKEIARLADAGEVIPSERIISFEDRSDLISLITKSRINLVAAAREKPGSIKELSVRLKRDRSSVSKDVVRLAKFGLVVVEEMPLPGHGRMKKVRAAADQLLLSVY